MTDKPKRPTSTNRMIAVMEKYMDREPRDPEKVFAEQLAAMQSDDIRQWAVNRMRELPSYFWYIPASIKSYHNKIDRQEGGLVRHTAAVFYMVQNMSEVFDLDDHALTPVASCTARTDHRAYLQAFDGLDIVLG